jgi:hypothetical protein
MAHNAAHNAASPLIIRLMAPALSNTALHN